MNNVNLVGRVATKPELTYTAGGTPVATMRLAVDRRSKDAKDSDADFFTIKAYGKLADAQKDYLDVGRLIAVNGHLHDDVYKVGDQRRERVVVIAAAIDWLDRPATTDSDAAA